MFKKVRDIIKQNLATEEKFNNMVNDAHDFYEDNIVVLTEEEKIVERKIGVCDHFRKKFPDRIKTDEEIIEHYNRLEDKYEQEQLELKEKENVQTK